MTATLVAGAPGVLSLAGLRGGSYERVSDDRSGRERSPEEQRTLNHRDADRFGVNIVEHYRDTVGASAYTPKTKRRNDWDRLKVDMATGAIDVLIAWSLDRMTRQAGEFAELADLCRAHGVLLLVDGRPYDMQNPDDEFALQLQVILAAREVGVLRKRTTRAQRASAEKGLPHGRVTWGYERVYDGGHLVGQRPDPVLGDVVREAFARFAAGESLRAIAADFDRRGVESPYGKCPDDCTRAHKRMGGKHSDGSWGTSGATKLRQVLMNGSYLGHRYYKGELLVADAWPALVDQITFDTVQNRIAYNRTNRTHDGSNNTKHLLSGLMRCGECGGPIMYQRLAPGREKRTTEVRLYTCRQRGCMGRQYDRVEAAVVRVVIKWATQPDVAARFAQGDGRRLVEATRQLKEIEARLSEAEDAMTVGTISAEAFGRMEAKLSPKVTELRNTVRVLSAPVPEVVRTMTGEDAAARWQSATLDQQRALIRAVFTDLRMLKVRGTGHERRAVGIAFRVRGDDRERVVMDDVTSD